MPVCCIIWHFGAGWHEAHFPSASPHPPGVATTHPVLAAVPPVAPKRPMLTSAIAYGPTTGQAFAAGALGVTYTGWRFTAAAPDGAKVAVTSFVPEARWGTTAATALKPSTTCELWEGAALRAGGVDCCSCAACCSKRQRCAQ